MEEKKNQSVAASTEQIREEPDSAEDLSENGPENASEFPAPEEKEPPQKADKGRKKRLALIFILSMLLLLAITLPLLFLDFGEVKDRLFPVKKQEIHYCAPDYQSNIWTDESYLKILGQKGYLELEGGLKFYFRNQESAEEALSQLAQETHGGAVLSAYLNNLLTGAEGETIQKFYALFSPAYEGTLPNRFPMQKLYGIRLEYQGTNDRQFEEWIVSFSILENDGTVVRYLASRDEGEARFVLEERGDNYFIREIHGIVPVEIR